MRILWLSRHRPLSVQRHWLTDRFGKVQIIQDVSPFIDAKEILRRYESGGYDDIVVVAPLWVILKLTELGIHPLWAEMQQVTNPAEAHVNAPTGYYRFVEFRRITGVTLEFEEV